MTRSISHHASVASLASPSPNPDKVADLKLVLLGESAVGKSSLVQRFATDSFDAAKESTIGAAFVTKKVYIEDSEAPEIIRLVNFQIWDTAGQERYKSLTPMYYRNANVAVVVFDITDAGSFDRAAHWINELKLYIRDHGLEDENGKHQGLQIVLVGNKKDLLVTEEGPAKPSPFAPKILEFLETTRYQYFEVSAKTGEGISGIFQQIVNAIPETQYVDVLDEDGDLLDGQNTRKRGIIDLRLGFSGDNSNDTCSC
ncbi:unnamed protein product [Kuraishia capsulata CBS 1993]|uniref:Uncharacterized protein n=1 Tax=Kuraishia capsulata CBS 1993 TaxID=1382522 RepID=W6MX20_9ASCO|nr:uncharacterized protein KUCA_T00004111001 [Kuraishia capsulata CBS 1993]CDK28130.1 unnamed protein product [Kuraishia capsulata CBS 1993]